MTQHNRNPVLAYEAPGAPGIHVALTLYSGSVVQTRGVVRVASTSPGDTTANWSDSGPLIWVSYAGDPEKIETVTYTDPSTAELLTRRVIRRDAVSGSGGVQTVKLVLSIEYVPVTFGGDFDPRDFGPDFFTGTG